MRVARRKQAGQCLLRSLKIKRVSRLLALQGCIVERTLSKKMSILVAKNTQGTIEEAQEQPSAGEVQMDDQVLGLFM